MKWSTKFEDPKTTTTTKTQKAECAFGCFGLNASLALCFGTVVRENNLVGMNDRGGCWPHSDRELNIERQMTSQYLLQGHTHKDLDSFYLPTSQRPHHLPKTSQGGTKHQNVGLWVKFVTKNTALVFFPWPALIHIHSSMNMLCSMFIGLENRTVRELSNCEIFHYRQGSWTHTQKG